MTSSEDTVRSANIASRAIEHRQMELTEASRQVLVGMLRTEMKDAVADGIKQAMTEDAAEKFWEMGLKVAQRQAAQKTGAFVGGMAWGLVRKALLFMVLGSIVYSVGGWTALVGTVKLIASDR